MDSKIPEAQQKHNTVFGIMEMKNHDKQTLYYKCIFLTDFLFASFHLKKERNHATINSFGEREGLNGIDQLSVIVNFT